MILIKFDQIWSNLIFFWKKSNIFFLLHKKNSQTQKKWFISQWVPFVKGLLYFHGCKMKPLNAKFQMNFFHSQSLLSKNSMALSGVTCNIWRHQSTWMHPNVLLVSLFCPKKKIQNSPDSHKLSINLSKSKKKSWGIMPLCKGELKLGMPCTSPPKKKTVKIP